MQFDLQRFRYTKALYTGRGRSASSKRPQHHRLRRIEIGIVRSRNTEPHVLILDAQYKAETTAKGSWFISDRSGVDAIVYGKCHAGKSGAEKLLSTSAWRYLENTLRKSLIVVCEPVVSWLKEDGLRLMPEDPLARYKNVCMIHQEFCNFLNAAGLPYALLPNTRLELIGRIRCVVREWEKSSGCMSGRNGRNA